MKKHKIKIDPEALADIQGITDWYNEGSLSIVCGNVASKLSPVL